MSKPNVDVVVGGPITGVASYQYKTVVLKANLPFAAQVTEPNCKYVVKWDFDLGGGAFDVNLADADTHSIGGVTYYYASYTANGKSYTILDDNLVFIDSNWNGLSARTITPDAGEAFMISSVTNKFYKNGCGIDVVSMPENCILEFDGGSINNGVLDLNNAMVSGNTDGVFNNIILLNIGNEEAYLSWFKTEGEITDIVNCLVRSTRVKTAHLNQGEYTLGKVYLNHSIDVSGHGCLIRPKALTEHSFCGIFECIDGTDTETFGFYDFRIIGGDDVTYAGSMQREFLSGFVFNFNNIKKVTLDGITIGRYWSSTNTTGYKELYTTILRCTDVTELVINGCEFYDSKSFEWLGFAPYNKRKEDLKVTFTNNYIHDVVMKSITLFVCNEIDFHDNVVDTYRYEGTIFNLFGNYTECYNNTFINTWCNAFDTCEQADYYKEYDEIHTPSGEDILYQQKVYIHDNVFNGIKPEGIEPATGKPNRNGYFLYTFASDTIIQNNEVKNVPLVKFCDARTSTVADIPDISIATEKSMTVSGNRVIIEGASFNGATDEGSDNWMLTALISIDNRYNSDYKIDISDNMFECDDNFDFDPSENNQDLRFGCFTNCGSIVISRNVIYGFAHSTISGGTDRTLFDSINYKTVGTYNTRVTKNISIADNICDIDNYYLAIKHIYSGDGTYNRAKDRTIYNNIYLNGCSIIAPENTIHMIKNLNVEGECTIHPNINYCYLRSDSVINAALMGVLIQNTYVRHGYTCNTMLESSVIQLPFVAGNYPHGTAFRVVADNDVSKTIILMDNYALDADAIAAIKEVVGSTTASYVCRQVDVDENRYHFLVLSKKNYAIFEYTIDVDYADKILATDIFDSLDKVSCYCKYEKVEAVWNGEEWTDERGFTPTVSRGTTEYRPVGKHKVGGSYEGVLDSSRDIGFRYYDTTIGKVIYAAAIENGADYEGDGTVTWVDALGKSLDTVYPTVVGDSTPVTGNLAKFNGTDIEDAGVAPEVNNEE